MVRDLGVEEEHAACRGAVRQPPGRRPPGALARERRADAEAAGGEGGDGEKPKKPRNRRHGRPR